MQQTMSPPLMYNFKECMELEALCDKWYANKDINVKNLGIYLKNVVDGYKDNINTDVNRGYVKYGTYARAFCEVLCNYLLKLTSENQFMSLNSKMQKAKQKFDGFPYREMNFVRSKTNRIVHGVCYNEDATKRFLHPKQQQQILLKIYNIACWLVIDKDDSLHMHLLVCGFFRLYSREILDQNVVSLCVQFC